MARLCRAVTKTGLTLASDRFPDSAIVLFIMDSFYFHYLWAALGFLCLIIPRGYLILLVHAVAISWVRPDCVRFSFWYVVALVTLMSFLSERRAKKLGTWSPSLKASLVSILCGAAACLVLYYLPILLFGLLRELLLTPTPVLPDRLDIIGAVLVALLVSLGFARRQQTDKAARRCFAWDVIRKVLLWAFVYASYFAISTLAFFLFGDMD